jgi:hypothetical protein
MSYPLDVEQILDHCMLNIRCASDAMVDDMHDAAMKLGTAEMMLASASHAVHKHAAELPQEAPESNTGGAWPRPG